MLTELPEAEATGEIAKIFAEIRHLYATPYVSSIHRHLATRPGVLEWAWGNVAPAFRSGEAQEKAWAAAAAVRLAPMPVIPREALAAWNVAPEDVGKLRAIAESFTRVAPLNLVFGGMITELLLKGVSGSAAARAATATDWRPPAQLPPPPAMVDAGRLPEAEARLLAMFRSGTGATAFVPGLYRMIAHWPGLLAHLAVELTPRFASAEKTTAAEALLDATRGIAGGLAHGLANPAIGRPPGGDEVAHLRRMIDGYRVTSPEMVLFGRLILEALPQD